MVSLSTIIFAYWGVKLAGALAALAYWIDRRRHHASPAPPHSFSGPVGAPPMAERRAPLMAGKKMERVITLPNAAWQMKTGDGLTFSGRTIWSYILRIATFSDKSHAGIIVKDDEGVWVVDSCEGRNVTKRQLFDEVKKYPGQWYWGAIRPEFNQNYHRQRATEAAMAMVANKTRYGWIGILLQTLIRVPILRELAYMTRLDRLPFYKNRPFCSQALKDWMHAGSLDPVPGRDGQLVVPQDINQSLAFKEWVALTP